MKKFSAILVCLLMIITCGLAGCATFSINKVKYYNEVIATVGNTKITRFDLLTAYNNYGESYYVQQMGQAEDEALNNTLELLIDRELLYQYALDNETKFKPDSYQINDIINEMFSSLDEQMETYVEEAKNILNIEVETETEEEKEEEKTAYKLDSYLYTPRAFVKEKQSNGETVYYIDYNENYNKSELQLTENNTKIALKYILNFKLKGIEKEIQEKYFEHFKKSLQLKEKDNADAIYNKVRSLFAKDLISYEQYLRDENNKPYNKITNDLIYRYIQRTFKNQIQSQYIENIRTNYLETTDLSIDLLIKEYNYLTQINYNQYNKNHASYKDKMANIGTDGNSVLYHPDTDAEFGYFIHTLISFDSIKDRLALIKEDAHDYKNQYKNIVNSLTVKPRSEETGLVEEDATPVSLSAILEYYNNIVNNSTDYNDKLSKFINFMFKYTGDEATLKQGMPYVIGYNPSEYTGNLKDNKLVGTHSAMVTEFTKEAINLMKQGKGSMSYVDTSDTNFLDNLCITEYGIHLLFYVDDVNAYDIPYQAGVTIETGEEDYIEETSKYNLAKKIINPLTKQTYFDKMFDLVYPASAEEVYPSNNEYSEYEQDILIPKIMKAYKVHKNTTKIESTKTSL